MEFPATHSSEIFFHDDKEVFFQGFERYFCFDSFDVRRRLVSSSGLYEYKATGCFPTVNAETLLSVYLDFDYRKSWDPHMLEGYPVLDKPVTPTAPLFDDVSRLCPSEALSPGADSGVEMADGTGSFIANRLNILRNQHLTPKSYYYAIKMPFPLATRDYVYSMRCWTEGSAFLVEGLSVRDLQIPKPKGGVRIEDFYQQIAVKNIGSGASASGTLLSMRYYDDPKGSIPNFVLNMAAQKGVPSFVEGLTKAAESYGNWLQKRC
ncbi:hypothetical protein HDU67_001906 [Dinochytrium kinnereticum]|nr:hypothetical protein HDU67_001906 [Dinochytrium kinnereticum]